MKLSFHKKGSKNKCSQSVSKSQLFSTNNQTSVNFLHTHTLLTSISSVGATEHTKNFFLLFSSLEKYLLEEYHAGLKKKRHFLKIEKGTERINNTFRYLNNLFKLIEKNGFLKKSRGVSFSTLICICFFRMFHLSHCFNLFSCLILLINK